LFGLEFSVLPADIDERRLNGESPREHVSRVALEKAQAIAGVHPGSWVLGSDTTVVFEGESLGKPANEAQAAEMLNALSGRSHEVMSAVALVGPESRALQAINVTVVQFGDLSNDWIRAYIASGDPMDKAGAYGIQNQAGTRIRRIVGSHSGVVGLPLYETGELLRSAGLIA
jgi:septum formation protein